jgi:hypothetical protein
MCKLVRKITILLVVASLTFALLIVTGCENKDKKVTNALSTGDVTSSDSESSDSNASSDTSGADSSDNTSSPDGGLLTMEDVYGEEMMKNLNKTFTISGKNVDKSEYNFYYINAFTELSTYASYGYYPATSEGLIDLSANCDLLYPETGTWSDYLNDYVEREIQKSYMIEGLAKAENITLSEDTIESLAGNADAIKQTAATAGLDADAYIGQYFGQEMTLDLYQSIMYRYYLAGYYIEQYVSAYEFSESDISLPTVRHILIAADSDADEATLTEAREKAEALLEEIDNYDNMVVVGDRELRDGNAAESAEYTVSRGRMVPEFEEWCFDEGRVEGDKGIVQTTYGFHVMYFVGNTEASDEEKKTIAQRALGQILTDKADSGEYDLVPVA